jgi:hypothetical protein
VHHSTLICTYCPKDPHVRYTGSSYDAAAEHVYVLAITNCCSGDRCMIRQAVLSLSLARIVCTIALLVQHAMQQGLFMLHERFMKAHDSYDRLTACDKAAGAVAKAVSPSLVTMCFLSSCYTNDCCRTACTLSKLHHSVQHSALRVK